MKYYCTELHCFNSGRVRAHCFEVEAEQKPEYETETNPECDILRMYFDTVEEAENCRDSLRKA